MAAPPGVVNDGPAAARPRPRAPAPCSYQLLIEVRRPLAIRVGALGAIRIPAGRWVYTGSARRHLEARIAWHLRRSKRLRWHIDHLLAAPGVRIAGVRRSRVAECVLNQRTRGAVPIAGFGASDCRRACRAHLKWRGSTPGSR